MLSHSSSMAFEVAGYWRQLEHAVIHIDPEHPKHAQWVTCLVIMQANWDIFSFVSEHSIIWQQLWLHSCSQHAYCILPQNICETSVVLCCVTKLHILERPFTVPSTRCTCVMSMLFNQFIYMLHLSGGWIILSKQKCSLTGM